MVVTKDGIAKIKRKEKYMQESTEEPKTHLLKSTMQLKNTDSNNSQSKNLPTSVCERLLDLMIQISEGEITPQKVNAACNCASQIAKFININLKL